jgi:MFS transporter, SP family, xylose:H+ symportor
MKLPGSNIPFVQRITLVATLGGFLFGYDTAVVSGAVKAIHGYFVVPLGNDPVMAKEVIMGYQITICIVTLIIWTAVSGMLIRLFGWIKGIPLSLVILAVAALILAGQFNTEVTISEDYANSITGFMVSSALAGCIVGGSVAGFISLAVGRRKGLMLAAVLFVLSALGAAFPEKMTIFSIQPLVAFILFRIIGGVGIGLCSMLSPLYIAETAPADIRGKLVSWNQFAIVLGILIVYFVNWFIAGHGNENWNMITGWRWMFLSGVFPSVIFMVLLFFIPETPRYLLLKNREDKARDVLKRTVGIGDAGKNMDEIKATLKGVSAPWLSFGGLLIIISTLLAAFQQLAGINIVLYYAPQIFQNMGTKLDVSLLQTVLVGAVNVIFTIIAIYTVDRIGRKPLLIAGGVIMSVSLAAVGFAFYAEKMSFLSLIFILVYIAGFAMSWGPVMWVVLSEIFPNSIRGAMSIATATVWITDLIVSWSFPVIDDNKWLVSQFHHGFTYWIYAALCLAAVIIVWKMVPETKGKTLEQIEKFWTGIPV